MAAGPPRPADPGREHRLGPPGTLLGTQPQRGLDREAAADEREDEQRGAEERVGDVAGPAGPQRVGERGVVGDELLDVPAHRAVGETDQEDPGCPRQQQAALQP